MTLGYAKMLAGMGIAVGLPRVWPIEWIDFRPHPCPHWPGVRLYRDRLDGELDIEPVVLCQKCFSILDGWHRVAAHWLEGQRYVVVQLADRHIAGAEEDCLVANLDWIHVLRPWVDLDCVSGSYLETDWDVSAFKDVRDQLVAFGDNGAKMRLWEHTRAVCFLGNVAGKRVLDIGTRSSLVPHWLAEQRAEVTCLDADISTIRDDGTVAIHRGDVRNLPAIGFDDDSFDHVLCTAVLKSLAGWYDRRAVQEMARVLKPRGLLAISIDYGQEYMEFPSKVTGVRLYDKVSLYERIIAPSRCELQGPVDFDRSDWDAWPIKYQSPKAFKAGVNVQAVFILLRKM